MSKDGYDNWVDRVTGGREGKPLSAGEVVATSADKPAPFNSIEFVTVAREYYVAEVGKRGDEYIYHFVDILGHDRFEDSLGDAFIEVFKNVDQIQSVFTPELESWAIKVTGFAQSPFGDTLAVKVFDVLDDILR